MAVEVRLPNGPVYVDMDGFRLSRNFTLEMYRSALKYQPRPDDMFVVTFPKCGTTWSQQIGYLIFHKGVPPPTALDFLKSSPFLEMFGADDVKAMKRPGLIKTHLPYHVLPQHPQAKYLVVCRNPKDTCVSFFHHTRAFAGYEFADGKFEDFFDVFMEGKNEFEDYFDHVLSWYSHRNDSNVLFLHYEDMKADPRSAVLKIAEFLDKDHHKLLVENEEMLENVIKYSDIKSMQVAAVENFKNFFVNDLEEDDVPAGLKAFHGAAKRQPNAGFIRKGVVGDWKQHFSAEMNKRMEEKIVDKLSHTDLIDVWKKYGIM
ncbi:unnamed protein product [Ixodes hexagonus]